MQTIFKKCSIKGNGKLSKLFCLILRGLNLSEGSNAPQNKILQGIRPRRTRSCRVSDQVELSLVGYQTLQNNGRVVYISQQTHVLQGLITYRTISCGAWYPTLQSPVEYHTPRNKVLRGIKLQGTTFKYEYLCEFETGFKIILDCEFGDYMGSICWKKTGGRKSCASLLLMWQSIKYVTKRFALNPLICDRSVNYGVPPWQSAYKLI